MAGDGGAQSACLLWSSHNDRSESIAAELAGISDFLGGVAWQLCTCGLHISASCGSRDSRAEGGCNGNRGGASEGETEVQPAAFEAAALKGGEAAAASAGLASVAPGAAALPAARETAALEDGEVAAVAAGLAEGEPQSGEKQAVLPRRPLMVSMPLFWQISISGETAFACAALCWTPPPSMGTFRRFTGVLEEESNCNGVLLLGVPSANT